jgi:uncharacterized membrane protein YccC
MSESERDKLVLIRGERSDVGEVLDISSFQQKLARIRAHNSQILEHTPAEWARRVSNIQEEIRAQRAQLEEALLDQMLAEEKAMLDRLEDIERNLRNMIRLYRQLMDERNAMCTGVTSLHRWIREMEQKESRKSHPDHGVELAQKSFVEYLSKQAWLFDNHKGEGQGWDLEETPRRRRSSAARA